MEGCKRRELRSAQKDVALAWHVANFSRAGKNFKNLDHYLKLTTARRAQTADDVAAVFLALKAKGRSVKIKERKRDGG